ncbi:MAG: hypothetical protein CMJ56_02550 [Planctomycetaceae bacterium]|nr:hypothetical protein [Planctomycetaceae bacterium]
MFLSFMVKGECVTAENRNTPSHASWRQKIIDVSNYTDATGIAAKTSSMLLLSTCFKNTTVGDDEVTQQLQKPYIRKFFADSDTPWVFCQLDYDECSKLPIPSMSMDAIRGGPGIFVFDYAHEPLKGQVVSVLPRKGGKYYRFVQQDLCLLAGLPAGSLTQRSMIFAVRRHADAPKSADGHCDSMLCEAANTHSAHQARLQNQGHHGWGKRSQQLSQRYGSASEVCAESWPDQDLLDSCIDCVSCWRQSPGHWRAISSEHSAFGYDIQKGKNSVWYATGIFIH